MTTPRVTRHKKTDGTPNAPNRSCDDVLVRYKAALASGDARLTCSDALLAGRDSRDTVQ